MRILIISKEAWRDEQNGGNVLSNIFEGFDAEFAQIYCTDNEPNNHLCKLYYQMTDKMIINNICRHGKIGKIKKFKSYPTQINGKMEDFSGIKKFNSCTIRIIRDILWCIAEWDIDEIFQFIREFNPDIIFAPCYGNHYMLKLTELVANYTKLPIISYISDDFYSNSQIRISPLYWIHHFLLRRNIRKVFTLYNLVYTMTEEQKEYCQNEFHANMKVLCKSGKFVKENIKKEIHNPIRFVYGGGIYLNRWKTLIQLANAMRKLNEDNVKVVLDIYTGTQVSKAVNKKLNDGVTVRLHKPVTLGELKSIYENSDIALHVEGFDKNSSRKVRLSFSTKIVDCLDSGCAVMAICDEKQAGYVYLKRNDAAICVSDLNKLECVLKDVVHDKNLILEYRKKAFALGYKNHRKEVIDTMIREDFENILQRES